MQNLHGVAIVVETEPYAKLSDAESVFGRGDALKPAHVTYGVLGPAGDAELNSSSRLGIELSEISFRGRCPYDGPTHIPYFRMTSS